VFPPNASNRFRRDPEHRRDLRVASASQEFGDTREVNVTDRNARTSGLDAESATHLSDGLRRDTEIACDFVIRNDA
jgi:hypothetical protein